MPRTEVTIRLAKSKKPTTLARQKKLAKTLISQPDKVDSRILKVSQLSPLKNPSLKGQIRTLIKNNIRIVPSLKLYLQNRF